MNTGERRFSVGWVLISYFLVAGGFVLAGAITTIFEISSSSKILGYIFLFVGAAIGGFFAGRASPGHTMVEPGFGALLLFVSLFALMALVPFVRELMSSADESGMAMAALSGLVVGAGGFAGGFIGEKTSGAPSHSKLRWLGMSALIALGAMFVVSMVVFMIVLRQKLDAEATSDNLDAGIGFAVLGLGALLGGLVTQAAAPKRMLLVSASGMAVVLLAILPLMLSAGGGRSEPILGMLVLAPLSIGVGSLGALLSWAFKRRSLKQTDVSAAFE